MGRTTFSGPIRSTAGFEIGETAITSTAAELNLVDNMWSSITLISETGGSGTCAIQMSFHDAAGTIMATPVAGTFYISEVATGLTVDVADTSLAVLTNGVITLVDTGVLSYWNYVTTAAGLLGLTLTAAADSYWFCFVHPTGRIVPVGPCICDA